MTPIKFKNVMVMESVDAGRHHISISCKNRQPHWFEIKEVREKFGDPNKIYVMVLPPKEYYVNFHKFCFHLWESVDQESNEIWKGM